MKFNTLLFALFYSVVAISQSLSSQVMACSGTFSAGDEASLSSTCGEAIVLTLESESNLLTQGFQQPFF